MADWFASGRMIDAILLLIAIEVPVLFWLARRAGADRPLLRSCAMLVPGAALMLALRAALLDGPWWHVAAWLTVAGLAHVLDIRLRFSGR